jgi:hypothetical protein
MFNENVADFEIYAGMWFARLYDYLERWAGSMLRIAEIKPQGEPLLCSDGVAHAVRCVRLARDAFGRP